MASTYLTRTPSGTSSTTITTHSLWFKRSEFENDFLYINFENGTNYGYIGFDSDRLDIRSSPGYVYVSTQKLRDPSAWYHLVVAVDNSLGTASDRVKIYLNGSRVTAFDTQTDPSSGAVNNLSVDNTASNLMNVGGYSGGNHFGGLMAHFHFIDGTAYDASAFGETDATTGIWKPKTAPSVTYGTNGFFLKFASAGSLGTDSSGNGNNFTLSGSGTQTQDTPSNVFATGNSLISGTDFLSNGNNTATSSSGLWRTAYSTLAVSSGKYYFETQPSGTSGVFSMVGIIDINQAVKDIYVGSASRGWGYENDGKIYNNSSQIATYNTYSNSDTIGIAVDLDNNYLYFSKNGVWENSGDPTSGATGTGGISITSGYDYCLVFGAYSANNVEANFGNGYFGTTAVSSAQSPSDGIGLFEYAVPSGYKALCTKSINAQEYS